MYGRGVAGDDDQLDIEGLQEADDALGEVVDLGWLLLAIGHMAAIREEDQALLREQRLRSAPDREPAYPRVEEANRTIVHRAIVSRGVTV